MKELFIILTAIILTIAFWLESIREDQNKMSKLLSDTNEWYILRVNKKKYLYHSLEVAEKNFKKWASIKSFEVSLEKRVVIDTQIKVKYPNMRTISK